MKTIECLFHSDPAHGWLEVPLLTFLQSGAKLSGVSAYSYFALKGGFDMTLYLEEDRDITVFLDAAKAKGWEVKTLHVIHQGDCFVRHLPGIPFEALKQEMERVGLEF